MFMKQLDSRIRGNDNGYEIKTALRLARFWHLMIGKPVSFESWRIWESTMKTKLMVSLLFASAAFIMPASANWFHNPYENINRNVGSAPNPTPADLREDRLPIVTKDEDKTDTTAAAKTASGDAARSTPAQSG